MFLPHSNVQNALTQAMPSTQRSLTFGLLNLGRACYAYVRARVNVSGRHLPNWRRGQPAALDIHATMQQQTLVGASTTPGYALQVGEERKMAAHAGVSFIPLVVESLGGWSYEAIQTIKSIGRLQGQRLGLPPPDTTRHLFQRLTIALWKGNASLWVRRQPVRSAIIDDFRFFVLFVFACFC